MDTAEMQQYNYGMRLYDPRIGRYMPIDGNDKAVSSPYKFAVKSAATKKGRKNGKSK